MRGNIAMSVFENERFAEGVYSAIDIEELEQSACGLDTVVEYGNFLRSRQSARAYKIEERRSKLNENAKDVYKKTGAYSDEALVKKELRFERKFDV